MDLNEYWQENKRFVLTVAGGLVVFAIGEMLIGSFLGDELAAKRGEVQRTRADLRKSRYGSSDLAEARRENEALIEVVGIFTEAVSFRPREGFTIDPGQGTPGNQYFAQAQDVRERVLRAAGRANVRIQQDLGLPALAPTRQEELERTLEALDLIERVCDIAIEAGVPRVDKIEIKLDPSLFTTKQTGSIERTKVKVRMVGPSAPLSRVIVMTQDPARGQPLLIDQLEMAPERSKQDEADLEITFAIVRLRNLEEADEEA